MREIVKFQKDNRLVADGILGPITANKIMQVAGIKNDQHLAHFLGQVAHETNGFKSSVESLNYSVSGLKKTFRHYRRNPFLATLHGRKRGQKANQVEIANAVYSDRNRSRSYKLGNIFEGDGWKYRGRGAIMITGRSNYNAFFEWLGISIRTNPDLVATKYYWQTAVWFFSVNNIWKYCYEVNDDTIRLVTKKINGGYNGYDHRKNLTYLFYRIAKR